MGGAHYRLLTALPPLGEPGTPPPMSLAELRSETARSSAAPLVDVIFLADDLRQRQAVRAGELQDAQPSVLTPEQFAGNAPLPFGFDEHSDENELAVDAMWAAYWQYAARIARLRRSGFLKAWVAHELALRNALAAQRSRTANRQDYAVVAPALVAEDDSADRVVAGWLQAADPLTGLRQLLRARYDWIVREEPHFTFSDDEVAAYAAKLVVLRDWQRTIGAMA